MRGCLAVICLVAGCDYAFRLDRVSDPPDAAPDIDHDGDGIVADDNCPATENFNQLDEDGDGVGNACDPHDDQQDELVLVELFEGTAPGWDSVGDWTMEPGTWTSPASELGGSLSYTLPRTLFRPAIQVGFTPLAYDTRTPDIRQLAVHLDDPSLSADCTFRHNPMATNTSQIVTHVRGVFSGGTITPGYVLGERYVGVFTRSLGLTACWIGSQRKSRNDDLLDEVYTAPLIMMQRIQVQLHHVSVYQVVQ